MKAHNLLRRETARSTIAWCLASFALLPAVILAQVPVGQDARPIGERSVPVGQDAYPVGMKSVPVGQGAVPVGQYSVPAGQDAVPTNSRDRIAQEQRRREANRLQAMKNERTSFLFQGESEPRLSAAAQRFIAAVQSPSILSSDVTDARDEENRKFAQIAIAATEEAAPADLFSESWWKARETVYAVNVPYRGRGTPSTWWGTPDWDQFVSMFGMAEDAEPFDFVYDRNVTFHNEIIYVNGQPIASYADFVSTAHQLVARATPVDQAGPVWTPLGTFALMIDPKTGETPHAIQLAVDANGTIAGVYTNWPQGAVMPIRGQVKPETQRVVFTIGVNSGLAVETGLGNFTEDVFRLWVHLPNHHSQAWLAARMQWKGE